MKAGRVYCEYRGELAGSFSVELTGQLTHNPVQYSVGNNNSNRSCNIGSQLQLLSLRKA